MDLEARNRLIEKALALFDDGNTLPAVTLDEFFTGNTDEGSIGVNLLEEQDIGLAGFRETLFTIRARQEVQDIFLELTDRSYERPPGG